MRQFDRRLAYHFDWLLLTLTLAIIAGGVVTIYSATAAHQHGNFTTNPLVIRQAFYAGAGLIGLIAVVLFDYRRLERYAYVVYGIGLVTLVLVPVVGSMGGGARRWIDLGLFSIQPSELTKIVLVIALARFFHRSHATGDLGLRDCVGPTILLAVPAGLILAQPDLGTVGILVFIFVSMVALAGFRFRSVLLILAVGAALAPLAWWYWPHVWGLLYPHQQRRVLTFLRPELDPLGAGYHVMQSKIAIGSGMFWGKGFLAGTQNKLNFLPEQHTDFIFSVFAEEWGYAGALVLIGLYAALVFRGLLVASRARDRFGALLAFGIVTIFFWQVVINVGMTSGILPVVGIPLPFFSYGGSSLTTMMIAVGLIINVNMRRFVF
jgi:rod shape determining protein RodA